jgi:hypothetical protein
VNSLWAWRSCSRVEAPALAAQPLAVQEMGSRELHSDPGPPQPLYRFAIERLRGLAVAHQGSRARLVPERPVSGSRAGHLAEALDSLGRALIQPSRHHRGQQRARISIAQTTNLQLRQPAQLIARLARREQNPHRLSQKPSRRKRHRLCRSRVQPLRIIDNAEQRTLLRDLRQQARQRQTNQQSTRRGSHPKAKHRPERIALRTRQPGQTIQYRGAQLVKRRERHLHLRLHTHHPQHPDVRRRLDRVLQQRRLPNPRLTTHHKHAASPTPYPCKQRLEHRAFTAPAP